MPRAAVLHSHTFEDPITAFGSSDPFSVGEVERLWIVLFAASVTGTTPKLNVVLEQQDAQGHWIGIASVPELAAAPAWQQLNLGGPSGHVLLDNARLSWAATGTDPAWTGVTMSVMGRG